MDNNVRNNFMPMQLINMTTLQKNVVIKKLSVMFIMY